MMLEAETCHAWQAVGTVIDLPRSVTSVFVGLDVTPALDRIYSAGVGSQLA
jgi:hypothetical protein